MVVVVAALQIPASTSVAKSHGISPPSPLCPWVFQPQCTALATPLPGHVPVSWEASRRENPGGLQKCPHLGEFSSASPWLFTIHRSQQDKRRDHTPKYPRFSPDNDTKLWDEFLFIWQKGEIVLWRSRRCVKALTIELRRRMAEQQPGVSERGSCIAEQEHPPASPHLLEKSPERWAKCLTSGGQWKGPSRALHQHLCILFQFSLAL